MTSSLTGYAYETTVGKSIIAGKTKGPANEEVEDDFGRSASLTDHIPDTPPPATLGVLAMGTLDAASGGGKNRPPRRLISRPIKWR
jgi:hypothetical protein